DEVSAFFWFNNEYMVFIGGAYDNKNKIRKHKLLSTLSGKYKEICAYRCWRIIRSYIFRTVTGKWLFDPNCPRDFNTWTLRSGRACSHVTKSLSYSCRHTSK